LNRSEKAIMGDKTKSTARIAPRTFMPPSRGRGRPRHTDTSTSA
jgi:hypothetical protein